MLTVLSQHMQIQDFPENNYFQNKWILELM